MARPVSSYHDLCERAEKHSWQLRLAVGGMYPDRTARRLGSLSVHNGKGDELAGHAVCMDGRRLPSAIEETAAVVLRQLEQQEQPA